MDQLSGNVCYKDLALNSDNNVDIIQPWPIVEPSEKCSFLTLTQFFDANTQFSGRMDGPI
jgi:hypothetical protein